VAGAATGAAAAGLGSTENAYIASYTNGGSFGPVNCLGPLIQAGLLIPSIQSCGCRITHPFFATVFANLASGTCVDFKGNVPTIEEKKNMLVSFHQWSDGVGIWSLPSWLLQALSCIPSWSV